jgi:dienelactone hydrolase
VLAGFSLGVLPAQMLAQNHPGALGALLYHGCVPTSEFGDGWPDGVPVQVHAMGGDPFFAEDADAARVLVAGAKDAELFLYPGDRHLFTDNSLPEYDEAATALVLERTLAFLAAVDRHAERGDRV